MTIKRKSFNRFEDDEDDDSARPPQPQRRKMWFHFAEHEPPPPAAIEAHPDEKPHDTAHRLHWNGLKGPWTMKRPSAIAPRALSPLSNALGAFKVPLSPSRTLPESDKESVASPPKLTSKNTWSRLAIHTLQTRFKTLQWKERDVESLDDVNVDQTSEMTTDTDHDKEAGKRHKSMYVFIGAALAAAIAVAILAVVIWTVHSQRSHDDVVGTATTIIATHNPSLSPSIQPLQAIGSPVRSPVQRTAAPTRRPNTPRPTRRPTRRPTSRPTRRPTLRPTYAPTCPNYPAPPELPGKKGIGLTLRDSGSGTWMENLPKVTLLRVHWNHSWGLKRPSLQPTSIEFVPMIWGDRDVATLQEQLLQFTLDSTIKRVLGFNEPDMEAQAFMSVDQAISLWPTMENAKFSLVSPSCAYPAADWMQTFMTQIDKSCGRVDWVGVHWYGGVDVSAFKATMQLYYQMYQRPLIITEFAPADWNATTVSENRFSPSQVLSFMKSVLPWLESQDWIVGYAWFPFEITTPEGTSSALFNAQGNLTALGQFYASVRRWNPSGNQSITV